MFKVSITANSIEELKEQIKSLIGFEAPLVAKAEKVAKAEIHGPVITQAQIEENVANAPVHELPKQPAIEEVRAALKELRERKGADAVREILKAYGADNLTQLKEEDYLGALARAQSEV